MIRRALRAWPVAALAALTYGPLLLTQPGWVSADTKTYLYTDPAQLLSRAWSMWDPSVGAGTVTHQNIGYLWPMGPFFWCAEQLGLPDWLAQRLWWGSILFAAGCGVAFLLRRFRWPAVAVWSAAVAYALSPYVLSLLARLSGVLLPFAGLPWLVALTIQALRSRTWRYPAAFALVVATVGSVNLTALVFVGLAPLLWIVHQVATKEVATGTAARAVLRIGILTTAVNAWWLAGLSVQATNGIDIVRYTETAEVVASTSTAHETLRGLGYWFFYGEDRLGPWIEPSVGYTQHLWLLTLTFLLPALGLLVLALTRWRHRSYFSVLLVTGVLVAVGAHQWDDPSPLGRVIRRGLEADGGLAFRSLPRAIPLSALAIAVLLAAGVAAGRRRAARLGTGLAAGVVILAVLALPPLWQGDTVPENLRREEDLPEYWLAAAAAIDDRDDGTRVLELPGSDFASYRWGNTVDPITPGISDRPYLARELIPYGSPQSANLLNALDLALQERRIDPQTIAPIARLLRVGDLVLRNDLQYERFNTPRPRLVWDLLRSAPGLEAPVGFGDPVRNVPDPIASLDDEVWLLRERVLPDPPPVAIVGVDGTPDIVSSKSTDQTLLLAGDGTGVVDAASASLIDGDELIRYAASLDGPALEAAISESAALLLTDTNRLRGERWTTVRHNLGYTEPAGTKPLADDPTDNRLPVFPDAGDDARTVALHEGGVTAQATSYGNGITFTGEDRAPLAIDGDPTTAWRTGFSFDARGERLRIDLSDAVTTDRVRILQPTGPFQNRNLTQVVLRLDDEEHLVTLDERSVQGAGQEVTFPETTFERLEIELQADTAGDRPRFRGQSAVGIAEVTIGASSPVLDEVIRLPRDLLSAPATQGSPLAILLTRVRQDSADPTRDDEERAMVRRFALPTARGFSLSGTARLSARAPDATIDELVGQGGPPTATSTERLPGSRAQRAVAAIDGDPATAWTGPFGRPTDLGIRVDAAQPTVIDGLDLMVVADGAHSVPTEVEVLVDGQRLGAFPVPSVVDGDEPGTARPAPVDLPSTRGQVIEVRVTGARTVEHNDWNGGQPIAHPVAIAELGLAGVTAPPAASSLDASCRTDLLTLDGEPLAVRVEGSTSDALSGAPLSLAACEPVDLSEGTHDVRAVAGRESGIDIDQLVLRSDPGGTASASRGPLVPAGGAAPPRVSIRDEDPSRLTVDVEGATPGEPFWLVLGQSFNEGWQASADGATVSETTLVDGYANGFLVDPDADQVAVELRFTPQRRVDIALGISAISALGCLVALGWRPRRGTPPDVPDEPRSWPLREGERGRDRPMRAATAVVVVGAVLGSLLLVPPVAAVVIGAVALAACWHPRVRRALPFLPPLLLGLCAAHVVLLQLRDSVEPGLEWPLETGRVHPIAMSAVALVAVELAVAAVWGRRRPPAEDV